MTKDARNAINIKILLKELNPIRISKKFRTNKCKNTIVYTLTDPHFTCIETAAKYFMRMIMHVKKF